MTEPRIGWFCTGRGSHDYAIISPGYTVWPPDEPGTHTGPLPAILRCPKCRLTKMIGRQQRQRLADAGLAEVDISALPF